MVFVEKKHYSSFVDSDLMRILEAASIKQVFIVGINTDYCVFATALDAFARGRFDTFVIEEGVTSIAGKRGHEEGLQRIRNHLGAGAIVSISDSKLFGQQMRIAS